METKKEFSERDYELAASRVLLDISSKISTNITLVMNTHGKKVAHKLIDKIGEMFSYDIKMCHKCHYECEKCWSEGEFIGKRDGFGEETYDYYLCPECGFKWRVAYIGGYYAEYEDDVEDYPEKFEWY